MRQLLHAEWTKLRTLDSTIWLLICAIALPVALSAGVVATTHVSGDRQQDPTQLSLIGVNLGQAVVAILAVLVVSEEYGSGLIQFSLTAAPRRIALLTAKAVVVTVFVCVVSMVTVGLCLLVGRLLLPGAGLSAANGYALVSVSHGPTLRAAFGSVVYLILIALMGLGVAAAVRETAVAIGVVLCLLYVLPVLAQLITDPSWHRRLQQIAPMIDGLAIQSATNVGGLPIGPWAGMGIVASWAAAALVVGGVLFRVRDA